MNTTARKRPRWSTLRIPLLVLFGVMLVVIGLLVHQQLTDVANLALGYCWRPSSAHLAVGATVPFDARYFAGGGEAISPFSRLDADGRFWYPAPGQAQWPHLGQASRLTLTSSNELVVRDADGRATRYLPGSSTTCSFTMTITARGAMLAWTAEVLAAAAAITLAWFLSGRIALITTRSAARYRQRSPEPR
jgi:hypothetical protein